MRSSNGLSPSARAGRFHLPIVLALFSITLPVSADEPAFDTWTSLDPPGGSIRQVAVAPSDPEIRYAVGDAVAQFYRWQETPQRWQRRCVLPFGSVMALAVDPVDPSTLWTSLLATDGSGAPWLGTSEDGGNHWTEVDLPPLETGDWLHALVVQPGRIFAVGVHSGVWRRDAGAWTRVLPADSGGDLVADPDDPDRLFAVVENDVWRTGDGGDTWTALLESGDALRVFAAEGSRAVYASFQVPTLPHPSGVHRSLDDGATWESFEGSLAAGLSPHEPDELWAVEFDGVSRSSDGGETWAPVDLGLDFHPRVTDIAFGGPGEIFLVGQRGVWTSRDDGATWSEANRGLREHAVVSVEIDPLDPAGLWALTQGSELFRSEDGGASWRRIYVFPVGTTAPFLFEVIASEPRTLLFTSRGSAGWWQSLDGGSTWETVLDSVDGEPPAVIYDLVSDFSPDPDDPSKILAAGWRGTNSLLLEARIWSTENGGRTWTLVDSRTEPRAFRQIRRDPFDPELFYLAGENLVRWKNRLLSIALGEFFSGEATHRIDAMAVDPATRGRLWAVAGQGPNSTGSPQPFGLLRSDDRGETWTKVSDRFDDREVTDLLVAPGDPDRLFAVVDARAWTSGDAGRTWQPLVDTGTPIQDLAIDPRFPSTLVSAAFGSGVQRLVFTDGAGCDAAPILCLADGFYAEVAWRDFDGATGIGRSVPLAASGPTDTGAFWFFDSANLELVVKALDGRAINGAFWVFYGSLSNVEYDLRVTAPDGRVAAYRNPLGTFASTGDTSAFPEP